MSSSLWHGNLTSVVYIGVWNLTPYGRGRGDLNKFPQDHGEARRHEETTVLCNVLVRNRKAFKSFVLCLKANNYSVLLVKI